jgi:hypothetical protein
VQASAWRARPTCHHRVVGYVCDCTFACLLKYSLVFFSSGFSFCISVLLSGLSVQSSISLTLSGADVSLDEDCSNFRHIKPRVKAVAVCHSCFCNDSFKLRRRLHSRAPRSRKFQTVEHKNFDIYFHELISVSGATRAVFDVAHARRRGRRGFQRLTCQLIHMKMRLQTRARAVLNWRRMARNSMCPSS